MTTKIPVELSSTPGIVDGSNATAITINSSEQVGIGTTSPSNKFVIAEGTNQHGIEFAPGTLSYIQAYDRATSDYGDLTIDAETIRFGTNNGAERMRIDASGNVGIGTTSPNMKVNISHADQDGLRFNTANDAETFIDFGDTDDNDIGRISYDHADNHMAFRTFNSERLRITDVGNIAYGVTSVSSVLTGKTLQVGYGQISSDHVAYNYNTNFTNNAYQSGNDATWSAITSRASGVIKLLEDKFIFMNASSGTAGQAVSMTERLRIDSSGNLMLGTTTSTSKFNIDYASTFGSVLKYTGSTTTIFPLVFTYGGSTSGSISTTSSATSYNTSSDYRLKENIQPLENGLERLNKLKPVQFDWKENDTSSEGFIAHEVQEIFPDAISGEKDGEDMQGMDYGRITPLLVKAIQEQQEQIEQLKAEIQTLKGE